MTGRALILVVFGIQAVCAVFFVYDIIGPFLGIRTGPIPWQAREAIEIGAALGLVLGLVMGGLMMRRAFLMRQRAEENLRRASGAFLDLLQERFGEWELTPAERDVALFAIKGLSTAEIASLRKTSEGTVKAQTNAIYRKAGVNGRSQLLSVFIEDLMRDDVMTREAASPPAASLSPSLPPAQAADGPIPAPLAVAAAAAAPQSGSDAPSSMA